MLNTNASITPEEFSRRWGRSTLSERASAQSHFIDLCHMLGKQTPAEADPDGTFYTFERGVNKSGAAGGKGFADVWYRKHFAIEYKGKHKDLKAAYDQLLRYREDLESPPLLVVCDIDRFEVHTNFTNSVAHVYSFTNAELPKPENLRVLRALFEDPESLAPSESTEAVTREAAEGFAKLSDGLRSRGIEPERASHFLNKLLFCLFAEDVGLLPKDIFSEILDASSQNPEWFVTYTSGLFEAMSTGGHTMLKRIRHFNGGLFADSETLPLEPPELKVLAQVSKLDWGSVEPAIFGTFFERSLDPAMRSKLGAHYTSKEDILTLIEPVLMAPLREEWQRVRDEAERLHKEASTKSGQGARNSLKKAQDSLQAFAGRLRSVRVLDPACGSGNFLYMSLKQLLDLEKEVSTFSSQLGMTAFFPEVSPDQLFGMELSPYAHELAQVVVWIGYLQWTRDNGYGSKGDPVLGNMSNIRQMDAIIAYDDEGEPVEPEWPQADVIVGNPPFLGGNKVRAELGGEYVETLFKVYEGRISAFADLVTYWFEKARDLVATGKVERVGLIATNSIRGGKNREVLKRIRESGDIFFAESDRPWVQNGAAVRVSMVGFDNGTQKDRTLDGLPAKQINSDLTGAVDITSAKVLAENRLLQFEGTKKGADFDLPPNEAQRILAEWGNPNGRPNSDVVKPWINGMDITRRARGFYVIDFGVARTLEDSALYGAPFKYVQSFVEPKYGMKRTRWWLHERSRPEMRLALSGLDRFIGTARVSKYRLFIWVDGKTLPDSATIAIARDDDYFFGVLHSRIHELWSLRMGTSLEDRPRYTPTSCFETFPFPWPPGEEPDDDPRTGDIAAAAQRLNELRNNWLNPEGASESELKKRTLTNLYNLRPAWLDQVHTKLDRAVFAAYDWDHGISDDDILTNLLALNLERNTNSAIKDKA